MEFKRNYFSYEDLPVESRIQILRNAVEFLKVRYPNGTVAMKVRDRRLEQLRQLEAQSS